MPTRILSWEQMVTEADPGFRRLSLQPWVYSFSNGRLFIDRPPPLYGDYTGWIDSSGNPMFDNAGNRMDNPTGTASTSDFNSDFSSDFQ